MRRRVLAYCLLVGMAPVLVQAAEPAPNSQPGSEQKAPAEPPADVAQPEVPERELVFEVSEEPYPSYLSAVWARDPKWLEMRYVAIIRLAAPNLNTVVGGAQGGIIRGRLLVFSNGTVFDAFAQDRQDRFHLGLWPQWKAGERWLQPMVEHMPEERRPSKELLFELQHTSTPDVWNTGAETPVLHVRARTAERAKELAPQMLSILDWGLWRPNQEKCVEAKKPHEKELAELRAADEERKGEVAQLEKELEALEAYEDLNKEALSGLTTQQRLIDVDLAGVKAQIEACSRILKEYQALRPDIYRNARVLGRVDAVETLKVTAEIELVGLTARKAAIGEIVGKGQARYSLSRKVSSLQLTQRRQHSEITKVEQIITQYEELRKANMPFPLEGKVVIHPIRWEVATEEKK